MLIKIDITNNCVLEISGKIPVNESLNSLVKKTDWKKTPIDWYKNKVTFDRPAFYFENNYFKALFLPTNYQGEIYFHLNKDDGCLYFCDDFFGLCSLLHIYKANNTEAFSTSWEGGLPPGETCCKEIGRLQPHSGYVVENGALNRYILPIVCFDNMSKNDLYDEFKKRLNAILDRYNKTDVALCLSGGADSRLLAMLLVNHGFDVTAYGSSFTEDIGQSECGIASKIASLLGIEFVPAVITLDDWNSDSVKSVARRMPESAHVTIPFYKIGQIISEKNNVVFSGQNADGFSGFAATDRPALNFHGILGLYKRICLTEFYLKGYTDVKGGNFFNSLFKDVVNTIGSRIYSKLKKRPAIVPNNAIQLVDNFYNSYDYTIFSDTPKKKKNKDFQQVTCRDVWSKLFYGMIDHLCKSGAPDIIRTTMTLPKAREVVLPYSDEWLIPVFFSQKYSSNYLFHPKEFIYKYIEELANEMGIKQLTKFAGKDFGIEYSYFDIHSYYSQVISDSQLGKCLLSISNQKSCPEGATYAEYFRSLLIDFWAYEVNKDLS